MKQMQSPFNYIILLIATQNVQLLLQYTLVVDQHISFLYLVFVPLDEYVCLLNNSNYFMFFFLCIHLNTDHKYIDLSVIFIHKML